jgi:RNA polymerase sigma-70 factor (ECF subfamily)
VGSLILQQPGIPFRRVPVPPSRDAALGPAPDVARERTFGKGEQAEAAWEAETRDAVLEQALQAARHGDEEGFTVLWRELHPPLLRYLAVRGNDSPEDVAAETWVQVVRDLSRFSGGIVQFRAWLFTLARHRAVDAGRSRAARPVVPVAEPHEVSPAGTVPSAEDAAADQAATTEALRLVAALPPDQAEMVMLRVVAGLDVATVASMVGKSPGAVRVAVHRALQKLSRDYQSNPAKGGAR